MKLLKIDRTCRNQIIFSKVEDKDNKKAQFFPLASQMNFQTNAFIKNLILKRR